MDIECHFDGKHNFFQMQPHYIPPNSVPTMPPMPPMAANCDPNNFTPNVPLPFVPFTPYSMNAPPYYQNPIHYGPPNGMSPMQEIPSYANSPPLLLQSHPPNIPFLNGHAYPQHNVISPNALSPRIPVPNGPAMNGQRQTDPRLMRRPPPIRPLSRWSETPNDQPSLQRPPVPPNRVAKEMPAKISALKITDRRRISIADYRRYVDDPFEREKDREADDPEPLVREDQNHNEVCTKSNGEEVAESQSVNHNEPHDEPVESPEPVFSPTELTPTDSPASTVIIGELSDHNEDSNEEMVNAAEEEVTVKDEIVNGDQLENVNEADYDSADTDDTVEFKFEEEIAKDEKANQETEVEVENILVEVCAEGTLLFAFYFEINLLFC